MSEYFNQKAATWDQQSHRVARAQEVAQKIKQQTMLPAQYRALDFGCGTGLLGLNFADSAAELVLADTATGMLEQVEHKITQQALTNTHSLNLEHQPLQGGFDLIFSLMVLHHIEDYPATVKLLSQHLNPRGYLCLADLEAEDGSFHAPKIVPHNGFQRTDLEEVYRANGITPSHYSTAFVIDKTIDGLERAYPVFLLIGQKL
ncbi:methyltransferase family protein [Azomonas agilis]|uniref:Methyltransferase family protein n=1 Tax=Azomonas agilis TaxID=116849 RepID=A0A562HYS4_9GAMM|nr:class I SAM-dependent methyltransferase [Azomonas agilis]TWH63937.1 methyltransferase family protein [Azomonas agilis]